MNNFGWIAHNNIAVCLSARSGSNTLRESLGDKVTYDDDEVMRFDTRIMFIREPVKRLVGTYTFYNYLNENDMNGQNIRIPKSVTHSGWEKWVDFIIENLTNGDRDLHWRPQVENAHLATRLIDLKKMSGEIGSRWSRVVKTGHIQREYLPVDLSYKRNELLAIYGADIALYKQVSE